MVDELVFHNALALVHPFLDKLYNQHYKLFKLFLEELYSDNAIWQEKPILSLLNQNEFSDLKACVVSENGAPTQAEIIKKAIMRTIVENAACDTKSEVMNSEYPTQPQLTDCADHYQPANHAVSSLHF